MGFLPLGLPYPRITQQPRVPLVRNEYTKQYEYRPGWWEIGIGQSGQGKLPTGNNFYGVLYKYLSSESVVILCYGWLSGFTGVGGRSLDYYEGILTPEMEAESDEEREQEKLDIMASYPPNWFGRTLDREKLLEAFAPWARTELDRDDWLAALSAHMGYDITEVLQIRFAPADSRQQYRRRP